MTVRPSALVASTALPIAQTKQYTAPDLTRTIVDKMTVTNTTAAALTFTAYIVPAGGAAGVSNRIIATQSVAPNTAYLCPEIVGHILNPGDFITTEASGTGLTGRISGREVN